MLIIIIITERVNTFTVTHIVFTVTRTSNGKDTHSIKTDRECMWEADIMFHKYLIQQYFHLLIVFK